MTKTVLDIERRPQYWDKVAADSEAHAAALMKDAADARKRAAQIRADLVEETPAEINTTGCLPAANYTPPRFGPFEF